MKFHNQTQHGRRYEISSRFGKSDEKTSKAKPKLKFKNKVEDEEEIAPEEIISSEEVTEEAQDTGDSKILKTFKFLQNKKSAEESSEETESEEAEETKSTPIIIKKKTGPVLKVKTDKLDDSDKETEKIAENKTPEKEIKSDLKVSAKEQKEEETPEVTEESGMDLKVDTIYSISNDDSGYGDYFGLSDDASIPDFYSDDVGISAPVEEEKNVESEQTSAKKADVEEEEPATEEAEVEAEPETVEAADTKEEEIETVAEEVESDDSGEYFSENTSSEFSTSSFDSEEKEDFSKEEFVSSQKEEKEISVDLPEIDKIEEKVEKQSAKPAASETNVETEEESGKEIIVESGNMEEARLALQKELEELNIEEFSFSGNKNAKFNRSMYSDITIISVNLDTSTVEDALEFKEYMMTTINSNAKKIIVDLSETDYIDSTFLGALVASLKKITAKKGELRLVCNQKMISMLFIIAGMDKIFKIFQDLNEAITSFRS